MISLFAFHLICALARKFPKYFAQKELREIRTSWHNFDVFCFQYRTRTISQQKTNDIACLTCEEIIGILKDYEDIFVANLVGKTLRDKAEHFLECFASINRTIMYEYEANFLKNYHSGHRIKILGKGSAQRITAKYAYYRRFYHLFVFGSAVGAFRAIGNLFRGLKKYRKVGKNIRYSSCYIQSISVKK